MSAGPFNVLIFLFSTFFTSPFCNVFTLDMLKEIFWDYYY